MSFGQYGDCSNNIPACSNPSFTVTPNGYGNLEEFDVFFSNVSNPQFNPNSSPGNQGCLQAGELNSTWIIINVSQGGNLEFSMGTAGTFNCFDWIMWPYNSNTCTAIYNNQLPPISCNWNGMCTGITGMASPGNLPAGADQSDFEYSISVNTGDQFILCFSNYSSATTNVPLNFFGSAQVTCGSVTNPTICYGETAEINVFDGVSYSWNTSTPGFVSSSGNAAYVNPTTTTDYTVTITFSDGSTVSATSTVTVLPQIVANISSTPETCTGSGDGSISVSITNAIAPINYSLSGAATQNNSSGNFNNLGAGNYVINITDANGCTTQESLTLNTGPACCGMTLSVSSTDVDCFGNCNGTLTVDTAGTSGSTSIQWYLNGSPVTGGTSTTISNVCGGNYSVEVTDALCSLTETGTVFAPSELTVTANKTDLNCFGDNSGTISISASGGTPSYSYSTDNGSTFQSSSSFNNLEANTYSILVEDANGCSKTTSVTLTEPAVLSASTSTTDNTCNQSNGPCDGLITTSVQGGTTPYDYFWSNMTTQNNATNLCSGNYSVTITDEKGCQVIINNVSVGEPDPIEIISIDEVRPGCNGDCSGQITINQVNGTSFSIDNGANFSSNLTYENLCAGNYKIFVQDDNGCSTSTSINLVSPNEVYADFTFSPNETIISNPIFELTPTSVNAQDHFWYYTYVDGDTTFITDYAPVLNFPDDNPRTYLTCIVASNDAACVDTACYELVVKDEFYAYIPNSFTPNGDGINDIFYPQVNNYTEESFEFLIFTRWGELIYKSAQPTDGWDGRHYSAAVPEGTYVWKIITKSKFDATPRELVGHVNLIR